MEGFTMYLTTKLPNPSYTPEVIKFYFYNITICKNHGFNLRLYILNIVPVEPLPEKKSCKLGELSKTTQLVEKIYKMYLID